jgi:CBS domain-containing protein
LPAADSVRDVLHSLNTKHRQSQRLPPVVDTNGLLVGVITRGEIRAQLEKFGDDVLGKRLEEIMRPHTIEAYPDEPLRAVVYRMAEKE